MSNPDCPVVTDDGSLTQFSSRYGETFHSTFGALTEAKHVFLESTGIAQRLADGQASSVLEIGFGLGLNFLLTADLAIQNAAPLTYHAYEHDMSSCATLRRMGYADLVNNPQLWDQLLLNLQAAEGERTVELTWLDILQLELVLSDASLARLPQNHYHAIYLDAFSPDSNAECWTESFLTVLRGALAEGGKLATYSAKGSVRRAMISAGLHVQKAPGPPGKREILIARHRA